MFMLMNNLLEYSDNYSKRSRSLWNYESDDNYSINSDKTTTSNLFRYKAKIKGSLTNDNNIKNIEVVVLMKYLSNAWRSFDLPLINCEVDLAL